MGGPEDFTSIRVTSLRGDIQIPFNVHILVAGKYILYCRQGDTFEGKRLDRLKAKKLKKLYIRREEEIPYKQYLEQSIDRAYNTKGPIQVRAEVIQGFQQTAAEDYMDDPLNDFFYGHVRSSVQRFTEFLQNETEALHALMSIPNTDQSISQHGVNVAALSVSMVQTSGLRSGHPLHLMALGGLLHDIEHHYTGFPVERAPETYTPEEKATYRKHPTAGAHRMQGANFLDPLVVSIITQHEEHIDGSGFPKGLREDDMDPLVTIVAVANAYDRLVGLNGKAPKDALKYLLIDKLGAFPLPVLQNLQAALKQRGLV